MTMTRYDDADDGVKIIAKEINLLYRPNLRDLDDV